MIINFFIMNKCSFETAIVSPAKYNANTAIAGLIKIAFSIMKIAV